LRMKLNSLDRHLLMTQTHDDSITSGRGNFQTGWQSLFRNHQRVVPPSAERFTQAHENCFAVMLNLGRLSVKDLRGPYHSGAKSLSDRLVAKANTKNRNATCKGANHCH